MRTNVRFSFCAQKVFTSEVAFGIHDRSFFPPSMDEVIATKEMQIERKYVVIELRENSRGRFLRITEESHGRRNAVIVPSTGLAEFHGAMGEIMKAAGETTAVKVE
jgi:hypothetical protein